MTDTTHDLRSALEPTWQHRERANAIRAAMHDGGWGLAADAHDWRPDHPLLQALASDTIGNGGEVNHIADASNMPSAVIASIVRNASQMTGPTGYLVNGRWIPAEGMWAIKVIDSDRVTPLFAHPPAAEPVGLREAAADACDSAFDHYRARNGRMCGIEGDDGEKCWIVPFDAMQRLRAVLDALPKQEVEPAAGVKDGLTSGEESQ